MAIGQSCQKRERLCTTARFGWMLAAAAIFRQTSVQQDHVLTQTRIVPSGPAWLGNEVADKCPVGQAFDFVWQAQLGRGQTRFVHKPA